MKGAHTTPSLVVYFPIIFYRLLTLATLIICAAQTRNTNVELYGTTDEKVSYFDVCYERERERERGEREMGDGETGERKRAGVGIGAAVQLCLVFTNF